MNQKTTPVRPHRDDASLDAMRRRVRGEADQLDEREEEATYDESRHP
jgi:hypothetical protein